MIGQHLLRRSVALVFVAMSGIHPVMLSAQENAPVSFERDISALREIRSAPSGSAASGGHQGTKCGLGPLLDIREHWNSYDAVQRREVSGLLTPFVTQKNRRIGNFTVFYDTTGINAPSLLDGSNVQISNTVEQYVDSVGKYFNMAWAVEIDSLGYDAPPFQSGEDSYDVYIHEENSGLYGLTMPVSQINTTYPPLYDSYIEIDNDYFGFYSPGMAGLKVTSAHEFHHAIQIGRYGYWSGDRYFLEITSTWMEDVVHDDVNDYYQYLSNSTDQVSQFSYPSIRFTKDDNSIEYSRAIWGKFIQERYSVNLMRSTWNYIRQMNALSALDRALADAGSSFRKAFNEWSLWNMNTGVNADTTTYFYKEGKSYPTMRMNPVDSITTGSLTTSGSTEVMSCQYYPLKVHAATGHSSRLISIITNVNLTSTAQLQAYTYIIADKGDDSYRHLANGLYAKLDVADPGNWAAQEIILDSGRHIETVPEIVSDIIVYPNPFLAGGSAKLNFHLPSVSVTEASLNILSSTMDRVVSLQAPVVQLKPLEPYLQWDGMDERGRVVSSGIYFYYITVGDRQFTGKFAVIRK